VGQYSSFGSKLARNSATAAFAHSSICFRKAAGGLQHRRSGMPTRTEVYVHVQVQVQVTGSSASTAYEYMQRTEEDVLVRHVLEKGGGLAELVQVQYVRLALVQDVALDPVRFQEIERLLLHGGVSVQLHVQVYRGTSIITGTGGGEGAGEHVGRRRHTLIWFSMLLKNSATGFMTRFSRLLTLFRNVFMSSVNGNT
jgi:hypothetical protein